MMIKFTQGNILEASTDALINTVNEVGVMGKGIALMFREAFPENSRAYEAACKAGDMHVGTMFVVKERDLTGERWIINFPTKKHWRNPSKLEWIREGLKDLVRVVREKRIRSVAVPPLGCGNGGLEWNQVRREIEAALGELDDVEIVVYEPTTTYQNAPKREGVQSLTPARRSLPNWCDGIPSWDWIARTLKFISWPGFCIEKSPDKHCGIFWIYGIPRTSMAPMPTTCGTCSMDLMEVISIARNG